MAENASSVFRTLRVVRRVPGGEETMRVATLLNSFAFAPTNPLTLAVLALGLSVEAFTKISQFIVNGEFILPNPQAGISYGDQVRKVLLERVYGVAKGDKLWNNEFATRETEIDLRAKWPG